MIEHGAKTPRSLVHAKPAEHPIIFSGPMVRAILAGKKTQTRRLVTPQPQGNTPGTYADLYNGGPEWAFWLPDNRMTEPRTWRCPYGKPGDRLWVREAFCIESNRGIEGEANYPPPHNDGRPIRRHDDPDWGRWWEHPHYRATDPHPELVTEDDLPCRWRPSIHMPRWASRITLEVTDVRAERLQEISVEDIAAEGVPVDWGVPCPANVKRESWEGMARQKFGALWDSINGERYRSYCASNPWVWVISFQRLT